MVFREVTQGNEAATRRGWPRMPGQAAALIAAVAISALFAADLTHFVLSTYRLHQGARRAAPEFVRPRHGAFDIARTIAGHLFGAAPVSGAQDESRAIADSGGTFHLTGVIATADPKFGSAMIGRPGQATHLYQAGGLLSGLASGRLYEVYEDHVVLDLDGRLETLRLPHAAGRADAVRILAQETGNSEQTVAAETPEVSDEQNTPMQPVSRAQGLFANLNPAAKIVKGRFSGMRLNPSADDEAKFGVRDGDVVVAVNGVKLTNANQNALNGLLTDQDDQHAQVSLTVLRDGTSQVIQMTDAN